MDKEYAKYLLKKTIQDYNLIAERFSRARERIWPELRFLFDDYLVPGERILDIGCGNGRFFEVFKEKKVEYFGIDSSEKLIEIAKKRYPEKEFLPSAKKKRATEHKGVHKFQVADALNLPFPDNYFDKIYSIAVLHHIPSKKLRLQFLKEAQRVLKKEGLLILTVWNLWPRFSKLIYKFALLKLIGRSKLDFKDVLKPWQNIPQCYFHCFTKKELERIFKKAGFKIKTSGEITVAKKPKPNSNFYIIAEK